MSNDSSDIPFLLSGDVEVKKQLLNLGLCLGFLLSATSEVFAVEPAPVKDSDSVQWSKIIDSPFDGRIVYDKNFNDDLIFVSSWAKSGIRATYTRIESKLLVIKPFGALEL